MMHVSGYKQSTISNWLWSVAFFSALFLSSLFLVAGTSYADAIDTESTEAPAVVDQPVVPEATSDVRPVEKKPAQETVKINSSTHLASVAMGLVLIVGLILILGWFLRRFNQGGLFHNSSIKILATLPLGTRERLAVIDVGGQQLLLGITATQINTLHVFNEPVIQPGDNTPAASDFGKKLMAILQQKNSQDSTESHNKSAV